MLTVITPATTTRLTTVSTVRDEFGITTDAASDAKVNRWIDFASQVIVDYCNRSFAQQTYLEQAWATLRTPYGLLLSRDPVTEISEVKLGGVIMDPADYMLSEGELYRLSDAGRPYPWGPSEIAATYTAGYTLPDPNNPNAAYTLPPTVELACLGEIQIRSSRTARDPLIRSETEDGVGATTYQIASGVGALGHPASAGLLDRYRVPVIG